MTKAIQKKATLESWICPACFTENKGGQTYCQRCEATEDADADEIAGIRWEIDSNRSQRIETELRNISWELAFLVVVFIVGVVLQIIFR